MRHNLKKFPSRVNADGIEEPITPPLPIHDLPATHGYRSDSFDDEEFDRLSSTPPLSYDRSPTLPDSSFPPEPVTPPLPAHLPLPPILFNPGYSRQTQHKTKRGKPKRPFIFTPRDLRRRRQSDSDSTARTEIAKLRRDISELHIDNTCYDRQNNDMKIENEDLRNQLREVLDKLRAQEDYSSALYTENEQLKRQSQADNNALKQIHREHAELKIQHNLSEAELQGMREHRVELESKLRCLGVVSPSLKRTVTSPTLKDNSSQYQLRQTFSSFSCEASWSQQSQRSNYNTPYSDASDNHDFDMQWQQQPPSFNKPCNQSQLHGKRARRWPNSDNTIQAGPGRRKNTNWRPTKRARTAANQWDRP